MPPSRAPRPYRWLLLLLPSTFRRRHGAELEASFAEALRDARRSRGLFGAATAWCAATLDLLWHAVRLRGARRSGGRRAGREAGAVSPPSLLGSLARELRVAARSLRHSPGFAVLAIVTLALGIGLNVAVFSVVDAVVIRPLPYPESDRLVQLWGTIDGEPTGFGNASLPDLQDWRARTTSFDSLAGYTDDRVVLGGAETPAIVEIARVTESFFRVLRVEAAVGRLIGPRDFAADAVSPIVISFATWRDRFGSDPAVLGRTIQLDDETYTIVGVLSPSRHALPSTDAEFWVRQEPGMHRGSRSLEAIGRLAVGVSLQQAQADLDRVAATLATAYADSNAGRSARLIPLKDLVVGDGGRLLVVLFGATTFVLLIATANLVNLFGARAVDRGRELLIRAAIGASRGQLILHRAAEALLLASCGGVLGILAARAALAAFLLLAPQDIPRLEEVALDATATVFAIAVTLLLALVVGVVPALRISEASRLQRSPASPPVARGALIAVQVALSVALLVGAGLLLRSFNRLQAVDKGFDADAVLSLRLELPAARYASAAEVVAFHETTLDRIAALPTVVGVGGITVLPFAGGNLSSDVVVDSSPREDLDVEFRSISHDYFATMGMSLLAGRAPAAEDDRDTLPVAVVNRTLARRAWGDADPIGHTITIFQRTWTVVGVVNDVRHFGPATPPAPEMYVPFRQQPRRYLTLVARAAGDPAGLTATIRELLEAADPQLPMADVATMSERVWRSTMAPRFRTGVLAVLAIAALTLAAVGVYGTTSLAVSRRTREIGIRRALGAQNASVIGLVVGRGMRAVLIGVAAGILLAAGLAGSLRGLLFEVDPLDAPTFVVAALIICTAALLGSMVPALRAAAVDPVSAIAAATESR